MNIEDQTLINYYLSYKRTLVLCFYVSYTRVVFYLQIANTGTLVLGCIREVHEYELVVSLPSSLRGIVPITNISDAYTAALTRLADSDESLTDQETVGSLLFCWFRCIIYFCWTFALLHNLICSRACTLGTVRRLLYGMFIIVVLY